MDGWGMHPRVRTGNELRFGERAADAMKAAIANWPALFLVLTFLAVWMVTHGFGVDAFPYILLNLVLSCIAALQGFVLLIAAKRSDQIAAEVAAHTLENTERHTARLKRIERALGINEGD